MNHADMFAQRLREKRVQEKLTQREAAERLNMSIAQIRANTHVHIFALLIEADNRILRQVMDMLDLV